MRTRKNSGVLIVFLTILVETHAQTPVLLVPEYGKVYHGVRTMTFESTADPLAGQHFSHTFNYNLPVKTNEFKIKLIAFVYRFTEDHKNDAVMNVAEARLIELPSSLEYEQGESINSVTFFPDPAGSVLNLGITVNKAEYYDFLISDLTGKTWNLANDFFLDKGIQRISLDIKRFTGGLYFLTIINKNEKFTRKIILLK